ncbi:hypothetical protein MAR_004847 [Mya arenaria]|uniref:Uncharacterized protein n=1 Tax=Mya arenaria TaxID=6604 RepID=A0ABY7F0W7_MYAAR|nr:uncharacterized protein LOC128203061 isoform X2 [Mya arenaria]WAR14742.1 hypothetical protein MAR_004847 [Mya arenaria]
MFLSNFHMSIVGFLKCCFTLTHANLSEEHKWKLKRVGFEIRNNGDMSYGELKDICLQIVRHNCEEDMATSFSEFLQRIENGNITMFQRAECTDLLVKWYNACLEYNTYFDEGLRVMSTLDLARINNVFSLKSTPIIYCSTVPIHADVKCVLEFYHGYKQRSFHLLVFGSVQNVMSNDGRGFMQEGLVSMYIVSDILTSMEKQQELVRKMSEGNMRLLKEDKINIAQGKVDIKSQRSHYKLVVNANVLKSRLWKMKSSKSQTSDIKRLIPKCTHCGGFKTGTSFSDHHHAILHWKLETEFTKHPSLLSELLCHFDVKVQMMTTPILARQRMVVNVTSQSPLMQCDRTLYLRKD